MATGCTRCSRGQSRAAGAQSRAITGLHPRRAPRVACRSAEAVLAFWRKRRRWRRWPCWQSRRPCAAAERAQERGNRCRGRWRPRGCLGARPSPAASQTPPRPWTRRDGNRAHGRWGRQAASRGEEGQLRDPIRPIEGQLGRLKDPRGADLRSREEGLERMPRSRSIRSSGWRHLHSDGDQVAIRWPPSKYKVAIKSVASRGAVESQSWSIMAHRMGLGKGIEGIGVTAAPSPPPPPSPSAVPSGHVAGTWSGTRTSE